MRPRGVRLLQTVGSVDAVLDTVLPEYAGAGETWLITGTGHHRGGHMAEGKLFQTTQAYLDSRGYNYKIGKSAQGHSGAFCVET